MEIKPNPIMGAKGGKEMIEHCLIYCCLGGKSLYKNYLSEKGEFVLAAKRNVLPHANVLNGTVCFSCDIGKAEEIKGKKFLKERKEVSGL